MKHIQDDNEEMVRLLGSSLGGPVIFQESSDCLLLICITVLVSLLTSIFDFAYGTWYQRKLGYSLGNGGQHEGGNSHHHHHGGGPHHGCDDGHQNYHYGDTHYGDEG